MQTLRTKIRWLDDNGEGSEGSTHGHVHWIETDRDHIGWQTLLLHGSVNRQLAYLIKYLVIHRIIYFLINDSYLLNNFSYLVVT